jgi:hypothetical protein
VVIASIARLGDPGASSILKLHDTPAWRLAGKTEEELVQLDSPPSWQTELRPR